MFKRLDYKDLEQKYLIVILRKSRHKLTGREIPCFSLNQLKLLSTALDLMLNVFAHSDVSLANILPIDYFKCMSMCNTTGYAETFLDLRKWLAKSTRLNQSMQLPLCCALRYLNFEVNGKPRFYRSPNISRCQVSDCHSKSVDENKDNEKEKLSNRWKVSIHYQILLLL